MVLLVIALFVFEFCGFLLVILGGEWKEVRFLRFIVKKSEGDY